MGALSIWHLLIIAFVALLFFGNRLPSVMRSLGSGINEFKKGLNEGQIEDKSEPNKSIPNEPKN